MDKNICNICGGSYVYKNGKWICSCCDNIRQDEITNEELVLLANAATKLRMADFDSAEELYLDFVKKYPKNSEGYWGLLLSKYGIKYEDDFDGKKIPTVYATSIESVLNDENYKKAIALADKETEKYYKQQANKFESIRQEWVEKASKEQPVDIFICYKDSDEEKDIARTDDSYEAQNLYTYLMSKGYSVFFSRESLRDKVAEKYEPYIFNALNTAHVMIVYSSSKEYLESTWVKNEWTRFLKKIKNKQKQENSLILVFDKMKPSDFPKVFSNVQCMNASQKTFYSDLEKHIQKVIKKATAPITRLERVEVKENVRHKRAKKLDTVIAKREIGSYNVEQLTGDEETQLKTAYKFLNRGLFADADEIITKILDKNSRNGQAILCKLLVNLEAKNIGELENHIDENVDFDELENSIGYSNKDVALQILSALKNACINEFNADNNEFALQLVDFICRYNVEDVNFNNRINEVITHLVIKDEIECADKLVRTLLRTLTDNTDSYLEEVEKTIDTFKKQGHFDIASKYVDEYLEIYPTSHKMLWKKISIDLKCRNEVELTSNIFKLEDISVFEKILECTKAGQERDGYIEKLLNIIQKCAEEVTSSEDFSKCCDVFDKIIKYTTQDEKYVKLIFRYAENCQEKGQFTHAEKYYAIVIGEDEQNHNAYWKLLQSKLKVKNNKELIEQPVIITTLPEFHSAIVAAGNDDKSVDRYIELKAKQISYLENQKIKKEKQKIRKRKIGIFSSIAAVIVAIVMGFSGWKIHYNANNTLLYTLNSSGTGYIVSAGKYYNEKSITIPRYYDGKLVTEIAANAFKDKDLEYISIPNTIEKIGNSAFYNCDNLKTLNLNISDIVEIPNNSSGNNNNENNNSSNNNGEENPSNNDTNQISFIYPLDNCRVIKDYSNNEFVFNETLKQWETHKAIDFTSDSSDYVKAVYSGTVTSVYNNYFEGYVVEITHNDNLKTIYRSLAENISTYVYEGKVVSQGSIIGKISNSAAFEAGNGKHVHFVVEEYGKSVNPYNYFINSHSLNSSKTINSAKNQQTISYNNKLTIIGEYAFYNCRNLEEFKTCNSITTIGTFAFANCSRLESFELPSELKRIEAGTFLGAFGYKDTTISIHNNIEFIGSNAFENCSKLIKIEVSEREAIPDTWDPDWKGNSEAVVEWTMNLTLDYQGATANNTVDKTSVTTGKPYQLPVPTKEGFVFDGWYSDRNGEGTQYTYANGYSINNWTGVSSIKVYANWISNNNSIIFNGNGATSGSMENFIIPSGESKTLPENQFVREGYTFAGWSTTSDGDVIYEDCDDYVMGIKPTNVLYANWTPNTNEIVFNPNGATSGEMANQQIKTGFVADLATNEYIRNGYTFAGWSTTRDGEVAYINGDTYTMGPNASYTLYAKWNLNNYVCTLKLNGGPIDQISSIVFNITSDDIEIKTPKRAGYTFIGWSGDGIDGTSMTYTISKGTYSNLEIEANWEANTNEIIFNPNGATSGNMNNQQIKTDVTTTLFANLFVKNGYTFAGWSTTQNGEVVYEDGANYTMGTNSSYTLYAVWELRNFVCTLKLNGGTIDQVSSVVFNITSNNIEIKTPTKIGYTFAGWSGDEIEGTTMTYTIPTGTYRDLVIEANWTPNLNTIIFDGNGSTSGSMENQQAYSDSKVQLNTNKYQKEGYTFIGWSLTKNGNVDFLDNEVFKVGIKNIYTVYAVWINGDTFLINNEKEFNALTTLDYNSFNEIKLMKDLNFNNSEISNFSYFTAIFNGNGFKISNFKLTDKNGLFDKIANAKIKNLGIENVHLTLTNIYSCLSNSFGGLVGYASNSQIENCYTTGIIDVNRCNYTQTDTRVYAGGIVGEFDSYTNNSIKNCYSKCNIIAKANLIAYAGGLLGSFTAGSSVTITIENCYATGNILTYAYTKHSDSRASSSGLVGDVNSYSSASGTATIKILNCFATGNLESYAGRYYNNCSAVNISNVSTNISNCFYESSQQYTHNVSTGLNNDRYSSPKTKEEILLFALENWDADIWIFSNDDYPTLNCLL